MLRNVLRGGKEKAHSKRLNSVVRFKSFSLEDNYGN